MTRNAFEFDDNVIGFDDDGSDVLIIIIIFILTRVTYKYDLTYKYDSK